jgi:CheY-like chemotaxis protein
MGRGSRFYFALALPSAEGLELSQPERLPVGLADEREVLALVVDDNSDNRDVLSGILEGIGVSVISAEDGRQAVDAAFTHSPDIVFMDIWMPVMDGLEAVKQILMRCGERCPKLVAVSASVLPHQRQSYLDAGFDDFIAKPIDSGSIYECISRLLNIHYQYNEVTPATVALPNIRLPISLIARLKQAAEHGEVTALREMLNEVRGSGVDGKIIAQHLHELICNLDMKGILRALEAISCE